MKIGKSTIQFNLSASVTRKTYERRFKSIADVPYWSLYARKGDCISPNWKSTRSLTYQEIVDYLTNFNGHRVLEAYPRKSYCRRHKYSYYYDKRLDQFYIVTEDGEVIYQCNALTGETIYISSDYKSSYKSSYNFKRKFFCKHDGVLMHTDLANQTIAEANTIVK